MATTPTPTKTPSTDSPSTSSGSSSSYQDPQRHDNDWDQIQIARLSVKPPPFWRENPALWFKQLESQFYTNGIKVSDTKFHIAVSALDTSVISQVSDIVMNPPANDKYERLKQQLQDRFADSEEQRFRKLLGNLDLGDKKPSHLWREMKELAGNDRFNEQVLKSLWMQRLPTQCQAILSTEEGDIQRLLTLADRIHEIYGFREVNALSTYTNTSSSNAQQTPPRDEAFSKLCEQVNNLTKQVASLTTTRTHSKHPNRSRSRSRSRTNANKPNCWYHHKFGKNATKCIAPCEFKASEN